ATRQHLAQEVGQPRQAVGTLAEVRKKAAETEAAIDQATRERDDMLGQLAATRQELDAAKQLLVDTSVKAQAQTQTLAQLRSETDQADQRLVLAKTETSNLEQNV